MTSPTSWRLRAQIAWQRQGPLPFAACALLLAGVLGWGWVLQSPGADDGMAGVAEPLARRVDSPQASAAALRQAWVQPDAVNPTIRTVLSQAEHAGLDVGRVDYRWPDAQTPHEAVRRLQIGLPLRGDYRQLKRFVGAVLVAAPGVSLDQLTLKREAAGDGRLDAMVWLSLWQAVP